MVFDQKLVSVIVPVFNAEEYIERTVKSVLDQLYQNFELLLLDDGSLDNTLQLCQKMKQNDERIKVYTHENKGVAITREIGFMRAKGDYITFLDSDDMLEPDFLSTMVGAMEKNNVDVVCCNCFDNGVINKSIEADRIVKSNPLYFIDAFIANKRFAYCIWAKVFRRDSIKNCEFPKMKYGEDALYVANCYQNVESVMLLEYAGYNYSYNPAGAMQNAKGIQQGMDVLLLHESILDICKRKYPSKCDDIEKLITKDLFNTICANSELEYKCNKKNTIIINSKIKKHWNVIKGGYKGLFVKAFFLFPKATNNTVIIIKKTKKYIKGLCNEFKSKHS